MAQQFMQTSGARESVWIHKDPVSNRPRFSALSSDVDTDICIVGAGIAGISTAYELVKRGHQVVLLEARDVLSGETGRTSGHLTDDLDDGFIDIAKKHGQEGARLAAESHGWARDHVGEVAQELGIECEYRKLPSYTVSQYPVGKSEHDDEMKGLREECEKQKDLGFDSIFDVSLSNRTEHSGDLTQTGKSKSQRLDRISQPERRSHRPQSSNFPSNKVSQRRLKLAQVPAQLQLLHAHTCDVS